MTNLVTPKLIEQVCKMSNGGEWRVCREFRFIACPISPSMAKRLVKLGWATTNVIRSLTDTLPPTTLVKLNEAGLARAAEFASMSEANGWDCSK